MIPPAGRRTRDEGRGAKKIASVRDLQVYGLAFEAAMEIFEISKFFRKRKNTN